MIKIKSDYKSDSLVHCDLGFKLRKQESTYWAIFP